MSIKPSASTRPLIVIPTAEIASSNPQEPPFWSMRSSYIRPAIEAGGTVVMLAQLMSIHDLDPLLEVVDGLLLAGGADIGPALYQAPASAYLETTDHARDRSELLITQWALQKKLPILAICRGAQMINIAAGGTLHQHIPDDVPLPITHRAEPLAYTTLHTSGHLIRITPQSRLAAIAPHPEIWVNSMHHQAIDQLGRGLTAVAHSADQVVEAIEVDDPHHWMIGLQSHPEAMVDREPWMQQLFTGFIAAASQYRAARHNSSI